MTAASDLPETVRIISSDLETNYKPPKQVFWIQKCQTARQSFAFDAEGLPNNLAVRRREIIEKRLGQSTSRSGIKLKKKQPISGLFSSHYETMARQPDRATSDM